MRLRLLIAEAWRSLATNVSTTFAATMTVLVGMFILGLFIALGTWTVSWSNHVKHELVVKVDFKTSGQKGGPATRQQENAVARVLQSNPKIKSACGPSWSWTSTTPPRSFPRRKPGPPRWIRKIRPTSTT